MPDRSIVLSNLLGAIGAAIGGVLGYFVFFWIAGQGFYALILPARSWDWVAACWRATRRPCAGRLRRGGGAARLLH